MKETEKTKAIKDAFWKSHVFVILDTETNGMSPEDGDEPCEVAMLKIIDGVVQPPHSWFVKTKKPIPPHVQAIHHISNEDIANAKPMEELAEEFKAFCRGTIIVAHNAPFDRGMMACLQGEEFKWVDNLRLAKHMWPVGTPSPSTGHPLPAHKNKILQHWLNLRVDTMGQAAHRAQADILVTAELFKEGVADYLATQKRVPTFKEFDTFLNSPCGVNTLNFGPWKDRPLQEVPTPYLRRLLKQDKSDLSSFTLGVDLEAAIKQEYTTRTSSQPMMDLATQAMHDRARMQALVQNTNGPAPSASALKR
jgi:DNA polymerase III epsilon subunit-like protein